VTKNYHFVGTAIPVTYAWPLTFLACYRHFNKKWWDEISFLGQNDEVIQLFSTYESNDVGIINSENTSIVTCYNHWTGKVLKEKRKDAPLVMMYKIANENVVITKTDTSSFIIPLCRTQQKQKSFFPHTISDWNQLPQPRVRSQTVEIF
jgi:hypothetical protein